MSGWYNLTKVVVDGQELHYYGGHLEFRTTPEGKIEYRKRGAHDRTVKIEARVEDTGIVIDYESLADIVLDRTDSPDRIVAMLQNPEFRKEFFEIITNRYSSIGFGPEEWTKIVAVTNESIVDSRLTDMAHKLASLQRDYDRIVRGLQYIDRVNSTMEFLDVRNKAGEPLRFERPDMLWFDSTRPMFPDLEMWQRFVRTAVVIGEADADGMVARFTGELTRQNVGWVTTATGNESKVDGTFDLRTALLAALGRVEEKKDVVD